jgi:hypothetical protein
LYDVYQACQQLHSLVTVRRKRLLPCVRRARCNPGCRLNWVRCFVFFNNRFAYGI